MELVHEKVPHALGVVDAPLELVPRVPVRYPADHRPLPPVGARRGARRRVAVGRRRRRGRVRRCWRGRAVIGDVRDGLADGAADGSGSRRELQRGAAAGAVHQHHRRRRIHFSFTVSPDDPRRECFGRRRDREREIAAWGVSR